MNRSTPLVRRTALVAKTGLRRTAPSPSSRVAKRRNQVKQQPKRRNTGPTAAVRKLVAARSDGWCEWAGCWLTAAETHHRLNRKNGGRHGEAHVRINQAAWLLHACRIHHDLVTSPSGPDRQLARESGWLLHEGEDARAIPVASRHGLVLLDDDGSATPTNQTVEEA